MSLMADGFLANLGNNFFPALLASAGTLIAGYVVIRERLLKNEIKMDNLHDHINNRDEVFNNKIKELQQDIAEFKEVNKETSKSLVENTAAVRELKLVLNLMRERFTGDKESDRPKKKTEY